MTTTTAPAEPTPLDWDQRMPGRGGHLEPLCCHLLRSTSRGLERIDVVVIARRRVRHPDFGGFVLLQREPKWDGPGITAWSGCVAWEWRSGSRPMVRAHLAAEPCPPEWGGA